VPKYNKKRGIVRKCDMCQGRLSAGEAPACVQACPTSAIAIRVVKRGTGFTSIPNTVNSDYTKPSTHYVSAKVMPMAAQAADATTFRVEPTHWPLVWMLVLTQISTGLFIASAMLGNSTLGYIASATLMLGMAAAGTHLGQPLKAWRAWMGWRKSWLSREIITFNGFIGAAAAANLNFVSLWIPAVLGLFSVFTSVMVYVDTKRPAWSMLETVPRFFGTVAITAAMGVGAFPVAMVLGVLKLSFTCRKLKFGPVKPWSIARVSFGLGGLALGWLHPALAMMLAFGSELLERVLYFKCGKAWRMPGL
jgi:DMSO reductase anchor subunit